MMEFLLKEFRVNGEDAEEEILAWMDDNMKDGRENAESDMKAMCEETRWKQFEKMYTRKIRWPAQRRQRRIYKVKSRTQGIGNRRR
jgi:hypothetical protein